MHFGRAALRLNTTQPTLSRTVHALEHSLGVELFDRSSRAIRLTSAGRTFLPEAKKILAITDTATNWARRAWRGEAGVIRLGFTATAAFVDLPLILERAASDLPGVDILLKEAISTVQKDALLSNMLDAAILRPPFDQTNFEAMLMRRERFVVALHRNDPRAELEQIVLADFDARPFIMYSPDGAGYSHAMLTRMFHEARVSPIITHLLDQNHSILALVSAGRGAALVPEGLAGIGFPNVVFRPIQMEPAEPLEMYLLWRPSNENPVLPAFLRMCAAAFAPRN
jgi:DNA-binding transcriptional LysR family regulator